LPFRAWKPFLQVLLILIVVLYIVGMGGRFALKDLGYGPGTIAFIALDLVTLAILALFAFRFITAPIILHFGQAGDDDTHGSARFATNREIAPLAKANDGLLIGRDGKTGRLLRYDGPAHLLTMAPTRTGKDVGTIIPNLLTADRSLICIDPKGENAKITGRARQKFGPVHVLDPFGITGLSSAAFNPLDALEPDGLDVAEDASSLAEALVHDEPGQGGEAHWNEEANALIAGLILKIVVKESRSRRTLSTLREYLTLPPDTFAALLKRMQDNEAVGGLIARAANRHLGKADREAAGVLLAAQRHTHFLDSPRMTAALGRSDFTFTDLETQTGSVFPRVAT